MTRSVFPALMPVQGQSLRFAEEWKQQAHFKTVYYDTQDDQSLEIDLERHASSKLAKVQIRFDLHCSSAARGEISYCASSSATSSYSDIAPALRSTSSEKLPDRSATVAIPDFLAASTS